MITRKIGAFVTALMCVAALGGCGAGNGTLSDEIIEETGAYKVTADDAAKGASLGSIGGGIDIQEGQLFMMSPVLDKGSLQVRLVDGEGEVVFDEEATGRILSTYHVDPGSYSLGITCNENGTTGTLVICPIDEQEYNEQNESLESALEDAGIDSDVAKAE